jgi:hypothetical protein
MTFEAVVYKTAQQDLGSLTRWRNRTSILSTLNSEPLLSFAHTHLPFSFHRISRNKQRFDWPTNYSKSSRVVARETRRPRYRKNPILTQSWIHHECTCNTHHHRSSMRVLACLVRSAVDRRIRQAAPKKMCPYPFMGMDIIWTRP